ncbi:Exopolysaccharide production protein [Gulosibacter molinativorax]|nr:Exopolysaccharide production protein [Gulosibacter molinativorax]
MKLMPSTGPESAAPSRGVFSEREIASEFHGKFTPQMLLLVATLILVFAGDLFRYTIGWVGYAIVVVAIVALAVVAYAKARPPLRIQHLPTSLLAFVGWCLVSVFWSRYPLETVAGSLVQIVTAFVALTMAVTLTRFQFIRALGVGMRLLVASSLLFELIAALFFREGVIPPTYLRPGVLENLLATDDIPSPLPVGFYWSRSDLFDGGPIQGIMGNRNLLAMVALLALIVTAAQLFDGVIGKIHGIVSIVLASVALALTDSATAYVALAFILFGTVLVYLGRKLRRAWRWVMYAVVGIGLLGGSYLAVAFNEQLFALMNRSSDMTGRGDIWRAVFKLGSESPVVGIGWISYWAPWLPEFDDLAIVQGMAYHQAHNAFFDVWMQVGFIGVALFIGLVFTTFIRTWWIAINRPDTPMVASRRDPAHGHLSGITTIPFLIMVALVVQGMTESRLIVEGGWFMLTYFAIYSKLRVQDVSILPRQTVGDRTGPITVILDPKRDL